MRSVLQFCKVRLPLAAAMLAASEAALGAELTGSEWRPTKIATTALPRASKLSISFMGDNKLAGFGGCNRFFGKYVVSGNELMIGPLGATRMACPNAVMDLESAFFAALEKARSFRQDKATLVLLDENGNQRASFVQAK